MQRGNELQNLLDQVGKECYGVSNSEAIRFGICIKCKKDVKPSDFEDQDSKMKYKQTALCVVCQKGDNNEESYMSDRDADSCNS